MEHKMSSSSCINCSASLGRYIPSWYTYTCTKCEKSPLCSTCCDFALAGTTSSNSNSDDEQPVPPVNNTVGSAVCQSCFKESSSLDFSKTYDVAGPENAQVILFLHAASLSRAAWSSQMAALSKDFRCYSMDLPKHGARIDDPTPLSTKSAVQGVKSFLEEHCPGKKVVLVGYSLGAFVVSAFINEHPDLIVGAALGGAGMDLASSFKGRLIGKLMRLMGGSMSAATKAQFASQQRETPEVVAADFDRCVLNPGLFFWENADETVDILLSVKMKEILSKAPRDLAKNIWLFVGSNDAQDFCDGWTVMTGGGKAIIYEGVGHELPFTSNTDMRNKFHADLTALAEQAFNN